MILILGIPFYDSMKESANTKIQAILKTENGCFNDRDGNINRC